MADRQIILYDNSSSGERMRQMGYRDSNGLVVILLASFFWLYFTYWLMAEAIKAWQHPMESLGWTTFITVAAIVTNGATVVALAVIAVWVLMAALGAILYLAHLCWMPFRCIRNLFRRG